jgi:hypothetical protein
VQEEDDDGGGDDDDEEDDNEKDDEKEEEEEDDDDDDGAASTRCFLLLPSSLDCRSSSRFLRICRYSVTLHDRCHASYRRCPSNEHFDLMKGLPS